MAPRGYVFIHVYVYTCNVHVRIHQFTTLVFCLLKLYTVVIRLVIIKDKYIHEKVIRLPKRVTRSIIHNSNIIIFSFT